MHDVVRFWLDRGADGFRIDVIYKIAKDPELGDYEPGLRHDEDWPTIHGRLRRIRAVIDEYDGRMIVGEVYLMDLRRVAEYINTGDQLHLAHLRLLPSPVAGRSVPCVRAGLHRPGQAFGLASVVP
jgi:alpha-glucosidase